MILSQTWTNYGRYCPSARPENRTPTEKWTPNWSKILPLEKGELWQNIIFTGLLYNFSYSKLPKMDKDFWIDKECNSCGICKKVCPRDNIEITDEGPQWMHNCDQCFACLQWCPKQAIQTNKKTPDYERYHHPEIRVKDIIETR